MASQPELGEFNTVITDEQYIQAELGSHIYTRADDLRLRALARVGLSAASITPGVSRLVTFHSPDYRLDVAIGDRYQLPAGDDTLRQITIKDNPYQGKEFKRGRFVEPNGTMWQMADSSQGLPWSVANLPPTDLVGMLSRLDALESSSYHVEVISSAYQPMTEATSAT